MSQTPPRTTPRERAERYIQIYSNWRRGRTPDEVEAVNDFATRAIWLEVAEECPISATANDTLAHEVADLLRVHCSSTANEEAIRTSTEHFLQQVAPTERAGIEAYIKSSFFYNNRNNSSLRTRHIYQRCLNIQDITRTPPRRGESSIQPPTVAPPDTHSLLRQVATALATPSRIFRRPDTPRPQIETGTDSVAPTPGYTTPPSGAATPRATSPAPTIVRPAPVPIPVVAPVLPIVAPAADDDRMADARIAALAEQVAALTLILGQTIKANRPTKTLHLIQFDGKQVTTFIGQVDTNYRVNN